MTKVYYNENDPFCVEWLKNLIAANLIPKGDVDARSILDVRPTDLTQYRQCHFFAGIGGWAYALALADFPADREVWTGSCPCQPFSAAGKGGGFADERHLWPYWFHLIAQQKPATILGEQVASKAGQIWLDLVHADLASEDYAFGVSNLAAGGVGAPHIRQRLWFVGDSKLGSVGWNGRGWIGEEAQGKGSGQVVGDSGFNSGSSGATGGQLAHPDGRQPSDGHLQRGGQQRQQPQNGFAMCVGNTERSRLQERERDGRIQRETLESSEGQAAERGSDACQLGDADSERENPLYGISGRPGVERARSAWADLDWLPCTDGKARPVEPGTFPLAHGIPGRVGRLRAYGNAIVPQVAAEFVKAYLEIAK